MNEEMINNAMQIILHAGDAKLIISETMHQLTIDNDIASAKIRLKDAGKELSKAHEIQTSLLVKEMRGENTEIGILMIHAQDHFMNAITMRDMAVMMIEMVESMENMHEKR